MKSKVSPHISRVECECRCGCGQCIESKKLFAMYEKLRAYFSSHFGRDVACPIHCINRCLEHNKLIGSKKTSQHVKGYGIDLHAYHVSIWELHKAAKAVHFKGNILTGGLGIYDWGIHIDIGRFRTWGKV